MFETKKPNYVPYIVGVVVVLLLLVGFFWWRSANENNTNNNTTNPTPTVTATSTVTTTPTVTVTSSTTATPTTTVTPTATTTGPVQVKVYYSQGEDPANTSAPDSLKQPTYFVYRIFTTSRGDVETYVLEKEIEGPSASDKSAYYWFTPIKLNGESNCGGKDFTLSKSADNSKVTVKFCKNVESAGIGDDARVKTIITQGIKQFVTDGSTVSVVILTKDDHCFGDMSGMDVCKN